MTRSRTAKSLASVLALLALLRGPVPAARAEDAIEYWTDYAIYPHRCVNYDGADRVMYAMFEQSSNHCTDSPIGTYVASVTDFAAAYLEQAADNAADAGEDDYAAPDAADYLECVNQQINGVDYYLQLGCSDESTKLLAVNVYDDADCTERSEADGYVDSGVELDFSVRFGKCTPCVVWMDKNDDEIDDQYYENKQTNAPLCSSMWMYREECNGQCQLTGRDVEEVEGWNKADKVLLSILSLFGLGMLLAIVKKRQKMSNKDALLEQAAISAAGLQQSHVLGMFALLILVIAMFALLRMKKITWGLLLVLNIVLFAYLMKLTVDGSVKETVIGPDGKIVDRDESDDEDEEDDGDPASPASAAGSPAGDYESPELPPVT